MKIILTESQVEKLIDEQMLSFVNFPGLTQNFLKLDPHTRNSIIGFGVSFVPFVGPALALGITTYDASLYWREGKKKEASLAMFLGMLPLISKLPIFKQIGSQAMSKLATKVLNNSELTELEIKAMDAIKVHPEYVDLAKNYLRKKATSVAKEKAAEFAYDAGKMVYDSAGKLIRKTTTGLASNAIKVVSNAPKVASNATKLVGKKV